MSTFGERLTQARKDKGLSQKEFAELLEITATRLNYWEKDKREPDIPFLHKICKTLDINGDWLIGRMEKNITPSEENANPTNEYTKHEQKVLTAYRAKSPDVQKAIDAALGVEPEKFDFEDEIKKIEESGVIEAMIRRNNTKS